MANEANIKAVITADDRASSVLKGFGNSVEHFGKMAAVGVIAAGAAVTAFGVASVKAFMESEDAIAQTNAVLKSTGGIAGVTADQVDQLASSLQKVTKFSDETIRTGENMLLTFTSIGKDIFPQATETMLDMSQALGQDVKSSAIQLGKALNDPINGVTALRRVGVKFTDAQQDVIKSLVETGKTAEAQKLILQELQTEFGGSAKAAGDTFAGKLEILKNSFNDVQEAIGKAIVDALTPFAKQLSDFVATEQFKQWVTEVTKWISENLPKAINYVTDTVIPALKNILELTWPVVKTLFDWFTQLVQFLADHEYVFWGIVGVLGAIKVAMFLHGALQAFQAVIGGVTASYSGLVALMSSPIVLPALAIGAVLGSIALMYNSYVQAKNAIDGMSDAIRGRIDSDTQAAQRLLRLVDTGTAQQKEAALKAAKGLGLNLSSQAGLAHYASGTDYHPGGMAIVGEKGPELVNLPRGASVTPNGSWGGGTVNLNVNVGMYAGTEIEKRKMAQTLLDAMRDLASGNNMTLGEMIK